jgi:cyclic beta-1,2-glucan synthetase
MYRAGLEWMLGFRLRGTRLTVDPCIPRAWPGFSIAFRHGSTPYEIVVENPQGASRGVSTVELDAMPLESHASIPLADDRKAHRIRIVLGG